MRNLNLQVKQSRPLSLLRGLHSLVKILHRCAQVSRQRRELADLDDRALRDIGISRVDADNEARRHFWDLPPREEGHRAQVNAQPAPGTAW